MNVLQEEMTKQYLFDKTVHEKEYISASVELVVENQSLEDNVFSHFSLMDFLYYDLNCIPKVTLMNFVKALRLKIMEEIAEFHPPDREQLLVLCQITDGSQTERNQSIITRRMLTLVNRKEMYLKQSSKLFDSQKTVSQEDLTSKYFPSSRKAEEIRESEEKSFFAAPGGNKKNQFSKKRVTESEAKIIESHNAEKRINASEDKLVVKTSACTKFFDEKNDTASTSEGEYTSNSLARPKTVKKREYIHECTEEWSQKTQFYQQYSTKSSVTSNEAKEVLTAKSVSSNGAYQEAVDKDRNAKNTAVTHIFSNRVTTHPNSFMNTSEKDWDCTSPVKNNSHPQFDEIGKPYYNYSEEEVNPDSVKAETSNESRGGEEQNFPVHKLINSGKIHNFNSKERRNECSNFAGCSMQRFFSDIINESGLNRNCGRRPATKAEEFIPSKMKNYPSKIFTYRPKGDGSTFGHFSLTDLFEYDIEHVPSDELKIYSFALKSRVLNIIFKLEPQYKEELEVLCELTDGNQSERNQKIICSRICALLQKIMAYEQLNHKKYPAMPRYQQQANNGNENYYLDRDRRQSLKE